MSPKSVLTSQSDNFPRWYQEVIARAEMAENGPVRGTCIHERSLDAAEITLRFPREWLEDWRGLAAGFDRLLAQLHP